MFKKVVCFLQNVKDVISNQSNAVQWENFCSNKNGCSAQFVQLYQIASISLSLIFKQQRERAFWWRKCHHYRHNHHNLRTLVPRLCWIKPPFPFVHLQFDILKCVNTSDYPNFSCKYDGVKHWMNRHLALYGMYQWSTCSSGPCCADMKRDRSRCGFTAAHTLN